ncbi:MAG: MFS transporter [Patescibacteria group bacterium]
MSKEAFSLEKPKGKFTPDIIALYSQRLIQNAATSLLGIFLPIFLYEKLNYSLKAVIVFYILEWLAYLLFIQPGARAMSRLGLKRSMMIGIPFLALSYVAYYFVQNGVWTFILIAIGMTTIWRCLYWVPYHTELAEFTSRRNRGRQLSYFNAIADLVGITIPIAAGFIIAKYGYQNLLIIVVILVFLSIFPLIFTRPVREKFSYGYFETYRLLVTKHRRLLFAYAAEGAENGIGLSIWPLFIYQILNHNYFEIGAVSTLAVLVTIVVQLIMGRFTDAFSKHKLLRWGTVIYAIGWGAKTFVTTGYQIFIASTYHNLASTVMRTPFDALTYEQMADAGHYVDEMSVFREMSLNIGRIIVFVLLFFLVGAIGLNTLFWIAAIFSLFINVI